MKRLITFLSVVTLLFTLFLSCSQKEQDIQLVSVTLSQPAAEMIVGESIVLKAIISPSNATEREVIWASSKQSVASVDQTGKVVAITEGTSTITATAGGKNATCVVTVSKGGVAVSSIILNKTSASLKAGETVTLTATVKPDDATDKTVTWSTSDDSIATVDNGVVTANKVGSAIITAKAGDKEASCAITVEATPVTSVTLDKTSASLKVGETVTLTATVKPDDATDKTVTWTTSDASVATIDNGVVTAVMLGSATITAKANDGSEVYAECAVTVKEPFVMSAVDLGLSVKWGNANLGADTEEGYGDYYAWGETESKSNYSPDTYKFGTGPFTKYDGTVDFMTVLEPEDDVAYVKLGGSWRMPTDAEWWELRNKCFWTWVTNYNGSGINGLLVRATNGNSIFLPAAGYYTQTFLDNVGSNGEYWSSSLRKDGPDCAWAEGFTSQKFANGGRFRFFGQSVRPVSE